MEDFDGGASALRGTGGPMRVLSQYRPDPIYTSGLKAAGAVYRQARKRLPL